MSIQQRLRDLVQELWTVPKEQKSRSYNELAPKITVLVKSNWTLF